MKLAREILQNTTFGNEKLYVCSTVFTDFFPSVTASPSWRMARRVHNQLETTGRVKNSIVQSVR